MVKITLSGRDKTRTLSKQQQYGNMIRKWKERVKSWDYLEATCFRFDDEKKRARHEKEIKIELEINKEKHGSIKFHSSGNVLIAFECYTLSSPKKYGYTAYPYFRGRVASKAAKNVVLKSEPEMDEYKLELEEVKKEQRLETIIYLLKHEEKDEEIRQNTIKQFKIKGDIDINDLWKPKKSILSESDLMEIIRESSDDTIRKAAVKRIDSQSFLKDVALNDSSQSVMLEAVERIDDESALAEIAKNANDPCVRHKAIDRIKDSDLTSEIEAYEKENYMLCEKCGGRYSIVSSHYNENWEWPFYDLKCQECGNAREIPQHILDEWPDDIRDENPMRKTTVFGKTFAIPEGYREVERHTSYNFENAHFKNSEGTEFEIKVNPKTNFPLGSPYIKWKIDREVNGIPGKKLHYENIKRFVYIDKNGLQVCIETKFGPIDEIYEIVVC